MEITKFRKTGRQCWDLSYLNSSLSGVNGYVYGGKFYVINISTMTKDQRDAQFGGKADGWGLLDGRCFDKISEAESALFTISNGAFNQGEPPIEQNPSFISFIRWTAPRRTKIAWLQSVGVEECGDDERRASGKKPHSSEELCALIDEKIKKIVERQLANG